MEYAIRYIAHSWVLFVAQGECYFAAQRFDGAAPTGIGAGLLR